MLNGVPPHIGAAVTGEDELFWPGNTDKGIAVGAITFDPVETRAPGFIKELSKKYGLVWRRISSAEIQRRRTTTLWR